MDEFGMLAKDFGLRPQGKSAPMKSSGGDRRSRHSPSSATFAADGKDIFNDVFGGPPEYNNNSKSTSSMSDFDYDSIFKDSISANNNDAKTKAASSNSPVYDKPVYDDDIFDGLSGIKSKPVSSSSPGRYDDNIFASMTKSSQQSDHFDDLFGNLGRTDKAEPGRHQSDKSSRGLDELITGFGSGSPASGSRWNSDPSPKSASKTAVDDPFVVLESMSTPSASSPGLFTDPLEEISKIGKSKSTKTGPSSARGDVFGDIDSLNGFYKSPPSSAKETTNNRRKGQSPSEEGSSVGSARSSVSREPTEESESHQTAFDMPTVFRSSPTSHTETSSQAGTSPKSEENVQHNDIWLTVSEIPLFTPVTRAPPPSRPPPPIPRKSSQLDDLESFAMGKMPSNSEDNAQEVREREHTNASRSKEVDRDEEITREREKERMREIEREKTRQAVERATREARERAASEARLKSERAAVQRAQAEARERAAVEAKGRAERAAAEARARALAEKAASEAKEKAAVAKAQAEARRRAERAAVEKVTAEARERAAAEARDRAAAAAAAKANQPKNDNDLDSFFNMGSRPNSVPRSRTASDSATDPLSQDKRAPEAAHRASSSAGASSKASPTNNFVDDLSSIFGAASPTGEFQDVEGETEERRRARLERHQRTQERAAKALAEKNQRDMQSQNEQEERHRISATLDVEIKRWASGKEGNLRAMLSTLQYVLWPECGWQPISLTDLITGASVKKAYRKATLCIHPDKVQQKGANLQQKYVAEKVFDLLKEAWNKFNSEELF